MSGGGQNANARMEEKSMKKNTVAIICARGGSKGLVRKNIRPLLGKPLIAYTIEAAKASRLVDRVIVSSDDDDIIQVAKEYGAETPFKRPQELATDNIVAEDVLKHAVEWLEENEEYKTDIVVYLQITDIFRKPEWIDQCIQKLLEDENLETAFVAYRTHKNYWRKKDGKYVRLMEKRPYLPRQVQEHVYREDAGLASATRADLIKKRIRVGNNVWILENDDFASSLDIHEEFDLWLAEKVMENRIKAASPQLESGGWLGSDVKTWSQSIRNGYSRSFILFALTELGVFETLRDRAPLTVEEIAKKHKINAHLLDGILNFLYHADKILVKKDNKFSLSKNGAWLFHSMTQAMALGAIGAYSCLLYELVPSLREEKKYGKDFVRRGDLIAKASFLTGQANYPWVVQTLKDLGVSVVADLGCGSANILINFCEMNKDLRGIGIDISSEAIQEATQRVAKAGLSQRIKLVQGDLTQPETYYSQVGDAEAFNGIMVLHEFLRDGEDYVVNILKDMKKHFPGRYLFIGEFDRLSDEEFQSMPYPDRIHPLFYQYIIHPLTWQGLPMEKERWLRLFERAGLKLIKMKDDFPFRLVEFVLQF